jgi:hypothetical protein
MSTLARPLPDLGPNVTVHLCGRRDVPPCTYAACGLRSTARCDYPVRRGDEPTTCGRALCDAHRHPRPNTAERTTSPDVDYCPAHAELVAKKAQADT